MICGSAGHGGYTLRLGSRRPELMDEIVACWKLAAPLLEKYKIYLGFESGIHTTVYKPDQFKELFDRVGSEWLTTTMDVTNMLSAEDYYDQHPKIDALFDRCRGRVHSAHLKDIVHEEKLHTHLNEAVAWRRAISTGSTCCSRSTERCRPGALATSRRPHGRRCRPRSTS